MPDDLATHLSAWRHHIHAHPELSLKESGTAAYVAAQLAALNIPHTTGIGGHGVVGVLARGTGPRVGLRADMDALPITEATQAPYASRHAGVMHACGHDGHTASLLGAARLLAADPDWRGTVILVFQPAEEGFGGAETMLADGLLARFPMDRIFGYHNWPGLALGEVMLHAHACMAGASNFEVSFHGKAGHAAMPHLTADPVQGLAQFILALNTIVARTTDPLDTAVISPCTLAAGQARNQIPETATVGGTIRALRPETMARLQTRLRETAEGIASAHGLRAEVVLFSQLAATVNHPEQADFAAQAAATAGLAVRRDMAPSMAAEDFGCFLRHIPGAFAWLGNGDSAPLHNPAYNYSDALLPVAARYLAAVAKAALA